MKAVMLGTSSGKPTLTRNVSAVAVVLEAEWLLLDCGEGTQMQILRAGLSTGRLAAICITHLHGDHLNGLVGLLATLGMDQRERPLTVLGPAGLREYLDTMVRLSILRTPYPLEIREFTDKDFPSIGSEEASVVPQNRAPTTVYHGEGYTVQAIPLEHRVPALGYRMAESARPGRFDVVRAQALGIPEGPLYGRLQAGESIRLPSGRWVRPEEVLGPTRPGTVLCYCTDTRPCPAAITLAHKSDLLIHEATFMEARAAEAHLYGHSTAAQAAQIARSAGVRRLLLTHISPRYTEARPLLQEARAVFPTTDLAEDFSEWSV